MITRAAIEMPFEEACEVLGVPPSEAPEGIRAAYIAKVKECPPERDPTAFERIRDAYDLLRDPRERVRQMVKIASVDLSITGALGECGGQRRFVGPELWLAVLKDRKGR